MNRLPGDSSEQRKAGQLLLDEFARRCGIHPDRLERNKKLCLENGSHIELDGFCKSPKTLCEAWVHIGKPKGSQPSKVMKDACKLRFANETLSDGSYELFLLFADPEAAARFQSGTWMAECLKEWNIKVAVIELDLETRRRLEQAQRRQRR